MKLMPEKKWFLNLLNHWLSISVVLMPQALEIFLTIKVFKKTNHHKYRFGFNNSYNYLSSLYRSTLTKLQYIYNDMKHTTERLP